MWVSFRQERRTVSIFVYTSFCTSWGILVADLLCLKEHSQSGGIVSAQRSLYRDIQVGITIVG
jgi:hypothetical protein